MEDLEHVRSALGAVMSGAEGGLSAADRLCLACVELLEVDGAAISLMHAGTTWGTFGSCGELSRRLDELQFTFGEGPCLDAVRHGGPVLVVDLEDPAEQRWPAYREAVLGSGVRAVFALPVDVSGCHVGALDLFRERRGPLSDTALAGGLLAAELAALPLLNLMTSDVDRFGAQPAGGGWEQLASLARAEVHQATGMIMEARNSSSTEALVRLRAYAFAQGLTASEVAWEVIERRLLLDTDDSRRGLGDPTGPFR